MDKLIDGILDLENIDKVQYYNTTSTYFQLEYYDLYDNIGDRRIRNSHNITEGRFGLYQLALKAAGGTNLLECGKLIEAGVVTDVKVKTIYSHSKITKELQIYGFDAINAVDFISKNQHRNNFYCSKCWKIENENGRETKTLIKEDKKPFLPTAAFRKVYTVKEDLTKIKDTLQDLKEKNGRITYESAIKINKEIDKIKRITSECMLPPKEKKLTNLSGFEEEEEDSL